MWLHSNRKFLKLILFSAGALVFAPIVKNLSSLLKLSPALADPEGKTEDFGQFKAVENKEEVVFKDKNSHEDILIIEK